MGKSVAPLDPLESPVSPIDAAMRVTVLSALFDRPMEEPRIGRYVVQGTLGSGGMGTVLEAIDPGLDRRVALKVLHRELDERHTTRLRREAQALAKLSHPNVVQVYEVGEVDGQTFVAMEKVTGRTLRDWVSRSPRPGWRECVDVYLQVGEGLVAAHEQGLVHRDFKPANAIIDAKGRVRVLDFGLARKVDGSYDDDSPQWVASKTDPEPVLDVSLTRTGAVLGTPAYMPPEQMRGEEADRRSDQFSFCVSLFEAVYGERPFEGKTIPALMQVMADGKLRPPPKGTKVPGRLRAALERGLAADPKQRWESMEALLEQLRRVVKPQRARWSAWTVMGLISSLTLGWIALERTTNADEAIGETASAPVPAQSLTSGVAKPEVVADVPVSSSEDTTVTPTKSDEPAEARGSTDEPTAARADTEQTDAPEPNKPKKTRKRSQTDASRRRKLARRIEDCGDRGVVRVTATLVRKSGELSRPHVTVKGAGAAKAEVETCAYRKLKGFKLRPRDQEELFKALEVGL